MKYQVQIQYTNPSHEHVSLRRRVETVNRLVEASTKDEAINRAANQQRALGYKIQEAKVISEPEIVETKSAQLDEQRKTSFGRSGGVMHHNPKTEKSEKDGTANVYDPKKHDKKLSPTGGFAKMKREEVEAVAEANVTKDLRTSMKMMDLRHGVDADKRVSGYKMSPTVRAAQKKSDELSKVVKRPQAGTLAAVHKSMERDMKKEATDPGSVRVVNKKVKAAEKMINAAKGRVNKVNMKPSIELEKYKD